MPKQQTEIKEHIGDGLYMIYDGNIYVKIAVNHHENVVAFIEDRDIESAIAFLKKCLPMRKNV